MSYTINPNAKNKWARNAENTMDLSLETDASSVYLDNGRTLEQEVGEGSMVSNVTTVDSAMSKVIDGTLDGAYESLIFKGQTLVNLATITSRVIVDNGWNVLGIRLNYPLSINSKYLINVFNLPSDMKYVLTNSKDSTWVMPAYVNEKTVFTSMCDSNKELTLHVNDSSTFRPLTREEVDKIQVLILEYQQGMENWDIPYFEGLCDVKMPILRNVGKNLFNPSLLLESETRFGITKNVVGETIVLNGTSSQYHDLHFTPNDNKTGIVVKKGKYYKLTIHCLGGTSTPVLNPAVKLTLKDGTIKWLGSNIDLRDSNCDGLLTWFRICPQEGNSFSNYQIKLQLEESSTSTSYEPYKTNILHTPETVTLRSLPNGVRDELNLKTGEYIKRIGEFVLDGSLQAESLYDKVGETVGFYFPVDTIQIKPAAVPDIPKIVICDKFRVESHEYQWAPDVWVDEEFLSAAPDGRIAIRLLATKASTIDELHQYLSQNPITVQYELATPIITTVDLIGVPFAYENGHVILESGYEGQSLLPTLKYSTVVNKTGQIESVAKTIQRQEKQLTMLEKMLIQNIINLDYNNTLLTLKNEMEEML